MYGKPLVFLIALVTVAFLMVGCDETTVGDSPTEPSLTLDIQVRQDGTQFHQLQAGDEPLTRGFYGSSALQQGAIAATAMARGATGIRSVSVERTAEIQCIPEQIGPGAPPARFQMPMDGDIDGNGVPEFPSHSPIRTVSDPENTPSLTAGLNFSTADLDSDYCKNANIFVATGQDMEAPRLFTTEIRIWGRAETADGIELLTPQFILCVEPFGRIDDPVLGSCDDLHAFIVEPRAGAFFDTIAHNGDGTVTVALEAGLEPAGTTPISEVIWYARPDGATQFDEIARGETADVRLRNPGLDSGGSDARGTYTIAVVVRDERGREVRDEREIEMLFVE